MSSRSLFRAFTWLLIIAVTFGAAGCTHSQHSRSAMVGGGIMLGVGALVAGIAGASMAASAEESVSCAYDVDCDYGDSVERTTTQGTFMWMGSTVAGVGTLTLLVGAITYGPNLRAEREARQSRIRFSPDRRGPTTPSPYPEEEPEVRWASVVSVYPVQGPDGVPRVALELEVPSDCSEDDESDLLMYSTLHPTIVAQRFLTSETSSGRRLALIVQPLAALMEDAAMSIAICNGPVRMDSYIRWMIIQAANPTPEN